MAQGFPFADEAFDNFWLVGDNFWFEDFDGHGVAGLGIGAPVDVACAPLTE